jgi:hypothetical protein
MNEQTFLFGFTVLPFGLYLRKHYAFLHPPVQKTKKLPFFSGAALKKPWTIPLAKVSIFAEHLVREITNRTPNIT